ncbi:transposase, partial [Streptococcus pseudopneumoniae]|nr:transposase [Streptococcus pseudopneumoniae]MBW8144138.1 transposase [Streptococcus pseudopneumoniae]
LPLPPYSPDSNPIEQAWAILKKKVTDLLREVPTIFECLERFLKLNDYNSYCPRKENKETSLCRT